MPELQFWKEQPSYYCGDDLHAAKQQKIQKAVEDHDLIGLLLIKSEAVRYATDFYVKGYRPFMDPEYLAIIPRGAEPVVGYTSGSDTYRIQIRSDIKDYRKLSKTSDWAESIVRILTDYGMTDGLIGTDLLPFYLHDGIKQALPRIEFVDVSDIWTELTVVKHPVEIELLTEAVRLTEIGILSAIEAIKPGVREYEVAAWAEYNMRKQGSEMTPFITNIASGINSAIFERVSTEKVIGDGEMVVIDLGCVWRGYTGDLGRTVCVGKPTLQQKAIYRTTHLALQEAINAVRPGVTCHDIDAIARQVIREEGYGKYEHRFSTGHQLGYGLHCEPSVNRGVNYVLKPGMIMALEPRVTVFDNPEVGGAHLEDVVLVTETGHRGLSKVRYEDALLE